MALVVLLLQAYTRFMPITFKSQAAGDLLMLQASAEALLSLLGKDAAQPGILEPKDMPSALAVLKGLSADEPEPIDLPTEATDDSDDVSAAPSADRPFADEPVTLRQRAWPLVRMIERALAENKPIVWGV